MELWKIIKDFTNYEISNYGNVRRKKCTIKYSNGMITEYKQKTLKQETINIKYKRVTFSENNIQKRYMVHRLVALYFIPNLQNKPCVNHKNGNGLNNHVTNLEWCTHSENEKHSYNILGKINPNRKLLKHDLLDIKNNCVKGSFRKKPFIKGNVNIFINKYNVTKNVILNVINNKYYV